MRRVLAFSACCAVLAGCGGGERQDANEPAGTYDLQVVASRFPRHQRISQPATLTIEVRNAGRQTAPDLAISLAGLSRASKQPGLADPERPVWIIAGQPRIGETAYDATWAVGELAPGASRELTWRLTPAVPGTHTLKWTVAAGLHGAAKASTRGGKRPMGSFTVNVNDTPAQATVDPATGAVVRK